MEILKGSAKSIFAPASILKLQQILKSTVELQLELYIFGSNFSICRRLVGGLEYFFRFRSDSIAPSWPRAEAFLPGF